MRIINLNPGTDIGASSWFVDIENHRLLLDAGTHPKREGLDSLPLYKLIKREELDAIAIVPLPSRPCRVAARSPFDIFPRRTCS